MKIQWEMLSSLNTEFRPLSREQSFIVVGESVLNMLDLVLAKQATGLPGTRTYLAATILIKDSLSDRKNIYATESKEGFATYSKIDKGNFFRDLLGYAVFESPSLDKRSYAFNFHEAIHWVPIEDSRYRDLVPNASWIFIRSINQRSHLGLINLRPAGGSPLSVKISSSLSRPPRAPKKSIAGFSEPQFCSGPGGIELENFSESSPVSMVPMVPMVPMPIEKTLSPGVGLNRQLLSQVINDLSHACGTYQRVNHSSAWRSFRHRSGIKEVFKFQEYLDQALVDLQEGKVPEVIQRLNQALVFLDLERERNYSRRESFSLAVDSYNKLFAKS